MKKWFAIAVTVLVVFCLVSMSVGCKKKATTGPSNTATSAGTATITGTPTATAVATVVADFDDGTLNDTFTYAVDTAGFTATNVAGGANSTADYCHMVGANIVALNGNDTGAFWFVGSASPTGLDLNHKKISFYHKGTAGTGSAVAFLMEINTTGITDYSFLRYWITPIAGGGTLPAAWTKVTIDVDTQIVKPSWGQGSGLTAGQMVTELTNCRNLVFAVADVAASAPYSHTGITWDLDEIKIR